MNRYGILKKFINLEVNSGDLYYENSRYKMAFNSCTVNADFYYISSSQLCLYHEYHQKAPKTVFYIEMAATFKVSLK